MIVMGGAMWQFSFPLIAVGMRMSGVTVIARRRQGGKTTQLIDMFVKSGRMRHAAIICPTSEEVRIVRSKLPPTALECVVLSAGDLEHYAEGRQPLDLYIDDAEIACPSEAAMTRNGHTIKAVTYSIP